jgi:hypothetical protein
VKSPGPAASLRAKGVCFSKQGRTEAIASGRDGSRRATTQRGSLRLILHRVRQRLIVLECSAVLADSLNLIAGSDPLKTQEELKRSLAVEVARAKTRRP